MTKDQELIAGCLLFSALDKQNSITHKLLVNVNKDLTSLQQAFARYYWNKKIKEFRKRMKKIYKRKLPSQTLYSLFKIEECMNSIWEGK